MTAPVEYRSITGEVQTKLPGITFGGTFPQLAARADQFTVVRSFASGNTDHQNYLSVAGAGNPLKASMGSLYSQSFVRSRSTRPHRDADGDRGLVKPEAVQPDLKLGKNFRDHSSARARQPAAAPLGPSYDGLRSERRRRAETEPRPAFAARRFDDLQEA